MSRPDDPAGRGWRFETFEERLAFSIQPPADFWYEPLADALAGSLAEPSSAFVQSLVQPLVSEGHGWTDLALARLQYGLGGGGQTVAIIDSGIAYDHVALGGGLGSSYKVVGGWDFAENDADPYDDGPAGFHGTHVAGIVGARDKRYPGVAPDANLVALRVFDDRGLGSFEWIEQALNWVQQHRDDFSSPITAVNLSLGALWNSTTLPQWTTLEDEFQRLADAGIFISVAAGNAFASYNAPGLAYPAASPHVTPVASVDARGNLSRFSQRDSRVLAAPGEKIVSTLPDAFYGGDGVKNDWGPASGTSMAAPYVAGASVLVREAMQKLGVEQITQASISDLLHRTADRIDDAITQASYDRINVGRALATLIGNDDYGSSAADAAPLGVLSTAHTVRGTIGTTSDQDYFQFTAAHSGTATLTLSGPAQLSPAWTYAGGGRLDGNKLTLDVVAGQSYVVGVAGGGTTIGKYSVEMQLAPATPPPPTAPPAADWGTIEQTRISDVAVSGETWFQATAANTAQFTVEAFYARSAGSVSVEVYDAQRQLLASSSQAGGLARLDVPAAAGQTLFVRVVGLHPDVDFRLTNLVAISSQSATVLGTSRGDTIRWQGDAQQILVNGVGYALRGTSQVTIDAGGGTDTLILVGGGASETVVLRPRSAELIAGNFRLTATSAESVQFLGGKTDEAWLHTAASEFWVQTPQWTRHSGSSFTNFVAGAGRVMRAATGDGPEPARLPAAGPRLPSAAVAALVEQLFAMQGEDSRSALARSRAAHQARSDVAALDALFQSAGQQ